MTRSGDAFGESSVNWSVQGGTASGSADFVQNAGVLTFGFGETTPDGRYTNDAGCGTFCVVPDAGRPFVPRPDAGVMTGGGNAGCACSTASAFGPMLALAALAVVARRRRR